MADPLSPDQDCNDLIEQQLMLKAVLVENILDADLVTYIGPIEDPPAVGLLKVSIEARPSRRKTVAVILETTGGYIEDAERMANVLRHNYERVSFVVTTYAMSAGTVLAMSGDDIYMDYSATLGPIDPQLEREGSGFVPAVGYLAQYDRLIKKSEKGDLTTAELMYLSQNFDPAELYQYEQARDLSIALLKEWLVTYKFADWTVTKDRGVSVTKEMKEERAEEIANLLNNTERWHSHSRGITMATLQREFRLQIEDIDQVEGLKEAFRQYWNLLWDYKMWRQHRLLSIHTGGGVYHGH
jgi:Serine dehydrogenase proteinase